MKIGSNEVFDCIEVAFDIRKAVFVLLGAAAAFAGALLLLWLGSASGNSALSLAAQLAAALYFYLIIVAVCGGTSIMAYKELTTGEKISVKDALDFSKKNFLSLVLSPVIWLAAPALVLLAEYVIFMTGKFAAGQIVLSLLTVPVMLLNAFILLFLLFGALLLFEIITVDGASPLASVNKLFALTRKASLQVLMYLIPVLIVGSFAAAAAFGVFLGANILSLALLGTASGLFAEMAAVEVPAFSPAAQMSWSIFSFFVSVISGLILAGLFVFLKASNIAIYLSVKERIK